MIGKSICFGESPAGIYGAYLSRAQVTDLRAAEYHTLSQHSLRRPLHGQSLVLSAIRVGMLCDQEI